MGNAVIGFPRWTAEVAYSGGSWSATYPASNLTKLPLSQVARTTGRALQDTKLVGTLPRGRPVRLFGICRHNLTLEARYRLKLFGDAMRGELLFDSAWTDVWQEVYPVEQLEWEDDNWWSGKYSTEEIAGYTWLLPIWLPQLYIIEAFELELDDQTNPDEHVEIGLLEISQGWQISINFSLGAQHGFVPNTIESKALGGVKYFERRDAPRRFIGSIDYLPHDETMARAFEHHRQLGIDQPFLWLPDPDATLHQLRKSYLARNIDPGLLAYARWDLDGGRDSVPLSFEEVL